MDPKLNNGETRSFWMRYGRGGVPRVRAHVYRTRLPVGEDEEKRGGLPSSLSRRIAGAVAFIILATIFYRCILTTARSISSYTIRFQG